PPPITHRRNDGSGPLRTNSRSKTHLQPFPRLAYAHRLRAPVPPQRSICCFRRLNIPDMNGGCLESFAQAESNPVQLLTSHRNPLDGLGDVIFARLGDEVW